MFTNASGLSVSYIDSFIFCYLAWDLCDPYRLRFVDLAHVEVDGTSRFWKILCMIIVNFKLFSILEVLVEFIVVLSSNFTGWVF